MAVQGITPFIHVEDANGNPYVGAKLYVYEAGTTTLRAIYSDNSLSVTLTNPLTSDSAGKFARFYMATGTYKLKATTSAGNELWTYDNIDTGLSAGSTTLPISGGGTGATTAAGARTNLDVPSNSELTALSSTISSLSSSIQNIVSGPQGYLTPTSGTPVISSGVTAGTAIYYTPLIGNLVPIYDGAQFNPTEFSELTLTLSSSHVANAIYDCFVISDSGTVRLVTGPAWNTASAGAGARGAGAGTTELVRTKGIWTNKYSMTARNGSTTYAVDASKGTYVGSIFMDGTNGQVTCNVDYGQSRKYGVWNAYNRKPIILQCGDSTSSWSYDTDTWRQSRATAGNALTVFCGLSEERATVDFAQNFLLGNATLGVRIGIGVNSTSANSAFSGTSASDGGTGGSTARGTATSRYILLPTIGINNINCLERVPAGSSMTFYGASDGMLMTAQWMG